MTSADCLDLVLDIVVRLLAPREPADREAVESLRGIIHDLRGFQVGLEAQRDLGRGFVTASRLPGALNTPQTEADLLRLRGDQELSAACLEDLLCRVRRLLGPEESPCDPSKEALCELASDQRVSTRSPK
jgi:hypothetical protein